MTAGGASSVAHLGSLAFDLKWGEKGFGAISRANRRCDGLARMAGLLGEGREGLNLPQWATLLITSTVRAAEPQTITHRSLGAGGEGGPAWMRNAGRFGCYSGGVDDEFMMKSFYSCSFVSAT